MPNHEFVYILNVMSVKKKSEHPDFSKFFLIKSKERQMFPNIYPL